MAEVLQIFHHFPPENAGQLNRAEYDYQLKDFLATLGQISANQLIKAYEADHEILEVGVPLVYAALGH
jgi:hypothetical protein